MENIEKIAFLVRTTGEIRECVRSALGLGIQDVIVALFIIDAPVETDGGQDVFLENLEMIDDLEGEIFSNVRANSDKYELIRFISLEAMAEKLLEYDLTAAF
ncbi:MAG: hypothetical protein SV487_01420 [Thermodesulfobacteriota bacterium]|nr:hypothetical protein [Thermodesulfobacteriota bacterium]